MSSLPNEIFSDISNFLPNDDITDLMLLSRTFNALVTPRLQKINQEMGTMNQSIKSFMPSPAPDKTDHEWISQLNLKKFAPIGSEAKTRMKDVFKNEEEFLNLLSYVTQDYQVSDRLKKGMSLERFDGETFLRILSALVSVPKFREEYNISKSFGRIIHVRACNFIDGASNLEAWEGEWIVQLNLKKFEPIGQEANEKAVENEDEFLHFLRNATMDIGRLDSFKARMSLERFDDDTFCRILSSLVSVPKFYEEYNISEFFSRCICMVAGCSLKNFSMDNCEAYEDLIRISKFYTGIP